MSEATSNEFVDAWTEHRVYLVDLAYRMLGSIQDAEDIVQDAYGRLLAQDVDDIDDVRGWMVVVVSRLCLDQLRSARVRREAATADLDDRDDAAVAPAGVGVGDPADRVTLDDSIQIALLVVLQQLAPSERAVFVLHDLFQFSFDAVADIVGRTPAACRQLASRARRHIEDEAGPARFEADAVAQREIAQRFIAACAGGNLDALIELLDPNVGGSIDLGDDLPRPGPFRGRRVIARNLLVFYGPVTGMTLVPQLVNGHPGAMAFHSGDLVAVLQLKAPEGTINDIHVMADRAKLAAVLKSRPSRRRSSGESHGVGE